MPEVICPHCRNSIYDEDALFCHFCGNSLNRTSASVLGKMRGAGMKWVWIGLALLIAVAFIAMMI